MSTCKLRDNIKKKLQKSDSNITNYGIDLARAGKRAARDIANIKGDTKKLIKRQVDKAESAYLNMSWRRRRPDLALLVEIALVLIIIIILYYTLPYITGKVKPSFSQEQFVAATKVPESAFSIEELAKVDLEVRALKDYASYFNSNPYSLKNSGIYDLFVSVALMPLIMFFIMFVLPPFVLAYIAWFVWRFWPYVRDALWGWFVTMYDYFTGLIQGTLGCKWYIRWVTGWGCGTPDFNEYVRAWRIRYVDRPIYQQKLRYIQRYFSARKTYYEEPYKKYVTDPLIKYKLKADYAKRIYVDRAIDVFLGKVQRKHRELYDLPRDELYRQILGNKKYLAGVYAKTEQAKRQIEGKPYPGLTKSGKSCMCPATTTPVKLLKQGLQSQGDEVKNDLSRAAEVGKAVYDKVTSADPCKIVDKTLENRSSIVGSLIVAVIVACIGIYVYSSIYGTPARVLDVLKPTTKIVASGAKIISESKSYYSLPLVYAVAIMIGLLVIW